MEDFLSSPMGIALISGVLLLVLILWSIQQHRDTQNEIARYEAITNEGLLKPIRGEVEYDYVAGEFGSTMQIFKAGTIIFDDDTTFLTKNESAFHHITKDCPKKNPNFTLHHQTETT
jgi:hypothetical protein